MKLQAEDASSDAEDPVDPGIAADRPRLEEELSIGSSDEDPGPKELLASWDGSEELMLCPR
jgi:hypothetical protein